MPSRHIACPFARPRIRVSALGATTSRQETPKCASSKPRSMNRGDLSHFQGRHPWRESPRATMKETARFCVD